MVLEDTSEGLLCSQRSGAAEGHASSNAVSPQCKRRRLLVEEKKEGKGKKEEAEKEEEPLAAVGSWGPTTVLTNCSQQGALYTVLVAVVHPCHLKEVKVGELGGVLWGSGRGLGGCPLGLVYRVSIRTREENQRTINIFSLIIKSRLKFIPQIRVKHL